MAEAVTTAFGCRKTVLDTKAMLTGSSFDGACEFPLVAEGVDESPSAPAARLVHAGQLDCSGTERARERGVRVGNGEDHPNCATRIQSGRQVRIVLHPEPCSRHKQLPDLESAAALSELTTGRSSEGATVELDCRGGIADSHGAITLIRPPVFVRSGSYGGLRSTI